MCAGNLIMVVKQRWCSARAQQRCMQVNVAVLIRLPLYVAERRLAAVLCSILLPQNTAG